MKWYSKLALLLLSPYLYFSPSLLLAQEKNNSSPQASDIEDTSPASLSGQDSETPYSRQDLCQINKGLSKASQSKEQIRSGTNSVLLGPPGEGKIRKGFPLTSVLGSLSKNNREKTQSKVTKTKPQSQDCE